MPIIPAAGRWRQKDEESFWLCRKDEVRAKEIVQRPRAHIALAETCIWFPAATSGGSQLSVTSAPEDLTPHPPKAHEHTCTHTYKERENRKINIF